MTSTKIYALAVLLAAAGCSNPQPESQPATRRCIAPELRERIQLETIRQAHWQPNLPLTGMVGYDEERVYRFVPLLSGVVSQMNVKLGDRVRKGQLLMEIQSPELSTMATELATARAQLALAQRKLQAEQQLRQSGVSADQDLLEAQAEAAAAQSAIARITKSAAIYGGSLESGTLLVRAALDGYIVEKNVVAGAQVEAGQNPLFVLSDLEEVWVQANIYTGQLGEISKGQVARITTTAYPGKVFEGRIDRLSGVFDPEERVLKAIITLHNRDLRLKPGMMVEVAVQKAAEAVAAVPVSAAVFDNNRFHVLKYRNECEVDIIPVETAFETKDTLYIRKGVAPGDTIITRNPLLIYAWLKDN